MLLVERLQVDVENVQSFDVFEHDADDEADGGQQIRGEAMKYGVPEAQSAQDFLRTRLLAMSGPVGLPPLHGVSNGPRVGLGQRVDIAMLQVKAGVWGLLGGLIPVLILLMVHYFTSR